MNCPISKYDIKIAKDIYVPNLCSLKGKTVRRQPIQVRDSMIPIHFNISEIQAY